MDGIKRGLLFSIVLFFLFFSCNFVLAQQIKYSLGPVCKKNNVICNNLKEIPTCLILNPKIHIEIITDTNGEKLNRFQPYCGSHPDNLLPYCIDTLNQDQIANSDVVLDCIELAECETDKSTNKLIATCSNGKSPKCLGDNSLPNCEATDTCKNESTPAICDYDSTWQASASLDRG